VKPDGTMDGHPASSKWTLFEAFAKNIVELAQSNPELWAHTAILITTDEGGGYYDSGFIQPVDFFGTGPRIPMEGKPRVQRAFLVREVRREELDARHDVERSQPRQPAEPDAGRERLRAGQHAGDRRPVRPVQLREELTVIVISSGRLEKIQSAVSRCGWQPATLFHQVVIPDAAIAATIRATGYKSYRRRAMRMAPMTRKVTPPKVNVAESRPSTKSWRRPSASAGGSKAAPSRPRIFIPRISPIAVRRALPAQVGFLNHSTINRR